MWPPRWYYSLPHATKGSIWGKRTRLFLRGRFLAKGPIFRGRPYRGIQGAHVNYKTTSGLIYRLSVFGPGAPGGGATHIVNVCSTAHSTPSPHIPGTYRAMRTPRAKHNPGRRPGPTGAGAGSDPDGQYWPIRTLYSTEHGFLGACSVLHRSV